MRKKCRLDMDRLTRRHGILDKLGDLLPEPPDFKAGLLFSREKDDA